MKLLVCGDRDWADQEAITEILRQLKPTLVIEGDARGADRMAGIAADLLGIQKAVFPADWGRHHKAAGPIRNQKMLDQKPDLILAFHDDLMNSKGTKDMIRRSLKAQTPVVVFSHAHGLHPPPVGLL